MRPINESGWDADTPTAKVERNTGKILQDPENDFRHTPVADLLLLMIVKYEDEGCGIAAKRPDLPLKLFPEWRPVLSGRAKAFWNVYQARASSSDQWVEIAFTGLNLGMPLEPDSILYPEARLSFDSNEQPVFPTMFSSDVLADVVDKTGFYKVYYRSTEKFLADPAVDQIFWRLIR